MKPLYVSILLTPFALTTLGQGTVRFDNNIPGVLVTHVYGVNMYAPVNLLGNGPADTPPGVMDWRDWSLIAGSSFSAQLLAAPGADQPFGSLLPASPVTTFQGGDHAGFVLPLVATLKGVPADAPVATVRMVAWNNQNGLLKDWFDAQFYSPGQGGQTDSFNVYDIGGGVNPPPVLTGLRSFSLEAIYALPEPSSAVLVGLGGLVLWLGRQQLHQRASRDASSSRA